MGQTQLNNLNWYDGKRKKPLLRIKVLRLLGTEGKLSIHKAESFLKAHHHREIWESFHALENKELITRMKIGTFDSGRWQRYYRLTDRGILALMKEGLSPHDFWRAIINGRRYTRRIDNDVINLHYREFLRNYLEYPSLMYNGYFLTQLHVFDYMCEKWVRDNVKEEEISLSQKIFETLALSPNLVPEQIAEKISVSVDSINMELERITRDTTFEEGGFLIGDDEPYDKHILLDIMGDFMFHNTIRKTKRQHGISTFSLSLYGVMLVIFLIQNYNAHRVTKKLLVFSKINIQQSLDIISDNYRDMLPMIFGEWNLLKSILGIVSVYNFNIIINKEARSNVLEASVLLDGCKEFYDATQGIALSSRKKLMNFLDAGLGELNYYREKLEKENKNLIKIIEGTILEIYIILGYPVGNNTETESLGSHGHLQRPSNDLNSVSIFQRAFAYEITFLYYFNQNRNTQYIPDLLPAPDYRFELNIPSLSDIHASQMGLVRPSSPKKRLLEIMSRSPRIREWFYNCIGDCIRYNDQAREIMNDLSVELSHQNGNKSIVTV